MTLFNCETSSLLSPFATFQMSNFKYPCENGQLTFTSKRNRCQALGHNLLSTNCTPLYNTIRPVKTSNIKISIKGSGHYW